MHKIIKKAYTIIPLILIIIALSISCKSGDNQHVVIHNEKELWELINDSKRKQDLLSIRIEGVETIPNRAFENCEFLVSVWLSDSVTILSDSAFSGCINLFNIRFPSEKLKIESYCFKETGIKELDFSEVKNLSIESDAFLRCSKLERVVFGENVDLLETNFINCEKLHEIVFPKNISVLDACMCEGCGSLLTLIIPQNIEVLDSCVAELSGVHEIVFEGTPKAICCLVTGRYPNLEALVFLEGPPLQDDEIMEDAYPENFGLVNSDSVIIFYTKKYRNLWSPNGETEWGGFHIECLDDRTEDYYCEIVK